MTIVIDASVALKWVLDEPGSGAAVDLQDEEMAAPSLWLLEAANALWRRVRMGELSGEQADIRLAELLTAPVATSAIEDDIVAAAQLAREIAHPVYDCLYLAAAIREDTFVVTADARFHAAVSSEGRLADRVRLLRE